MAVSQVPADTAMARPDELAVRARRRIAGCATVMVLAAMAIGVVAYLLSPQPATARDVLGLALAVVACELLRAHRAPYRGRGGASVFYNGVPAVHVAAVMLLPVLLLPALAALDLVKPRPGLWRFWNFASHLLCLATAAAAFRVAVGHTPLAVAGMSAALVYWLVETSTFTWVEIVSDGVPASQNGMWSWFAVAVDLAILAVGVLVAVALTWDGWSLVPVASTLALLGVGVAALGRAREADFDAKTGLMALHALRRWSEGEFTRASRSGAPVSVLMIDLDHFRDVNTLHGHVVGDAALQHAARVVCTGRRVSDLCARYGGEEIVVVLPDTALASAAAAADRVLHELRSSPLQVGAAVLRLTASAGVAQWVAGDRLEDVIARADRALYEAKASGRDQVKVAV